MKTSTSNNNQGQGKRSLRPLASIVRRLRSYITSAQRDLSSSLKMECSYESLPVPTTAQEATAKMLYHCSKYQSLHDVQAIVQRFPGCLTGSNHLAQTPLHVAASIGVSCEVLTFLILSYPHACWVIDAYGKFPLHYAASPSKWIVPAGCGFFLDGQQRYADSTTSLGPQSYSSMLKLMCMLNPQAVTHEDFDGQTPIEMALADPASDASIVRILHCASTRHWEQIKHAERTPANAPITEDARCAVTSRSA
jgi:hypothetical protein